MQALITEDSIQQLIIPNPDCECMCMNTYEGSGPINLVLILTWSYYEHLSSAFIQVQDQVLNESQMVLTIHTFIQEGRTRLVVDLTGLLSIKE